MITILRKHHRWLMIVIAVLAIPFVFYFNKTDFNAARQGSIGRIYDRPVTRVEFQRNARLFNLARDLGMFTLLQDLTAGAATEAEAYSEFTWNRLILHHEAERLGIAANSSEIVETVKTLMPFRGQSGFDINKYNEFAQSALPSMGFTEAQIEELVADQLCLSRIKELIGSGIHVTEAESLENYQQNYGKLDVGVVRLRSEDFAKDVKITDEDIAKYYEAHKADLKSEEKRRIEFTSFALTEEQKKLTGKEKVDALQKVADHANDFTQALLEKGANFGEVAKKFQAPVRATGDFTVTTPDPQMVSDPQLTQYAFQLTEKEPFSDAIQGADGFYVLHLTGVIAAHSLNLEEAKPKMVEVLKTQRLRELVSNKGGEITRKIREALKTGAPLDKAAQDAGGKIERVPPFSLAESQPPKLDPAKPEPPKDPKNDVPDLPQIKSAVSELSPGEATEFIPSEKGGMIAVLEKREPLDPSGYEQAKAVFEERFVRGKRGVVFYEWLQDRRHAAGLEVSSG